MICLKCGRLIFELPQFGEMTSNNVDFYKKLKVTVTPNLCHKYECIFGRSDVKEECLNMNRALPQRLTTQTVETSLMFL